jgi:hypothetical protein
MSVTSHVYNSLWASHTQWSDTLTFDTSAGTFSRRTNPTANAGTFTYDGTNLVMTWTGNNGGTEYLLGAGGSNFASSNINDVAPVSYSFGTFFDSAGGASNLTTYP